MSEQAAQQRFNSRAEPVRHLATPVALGRLEMKVLGNTLRSVVRYRHSQITPEHLLLGLCVGPRGERVLASAVLSLLGLTARPLETAMRSHLKITGGTAPRRWLGSGKGSVPFSPAARQVLADTRAWTLELGLQESTPGVMLLALLAQPGSPAAQTLHSHGVDQDHVRAAVQERQD